MKLGGMIILLTLLAGLPGPARAQGPESGQARPVTPATLSAPRAPAAPVNAQLSIDKVDACHKVALVGRKGNDIYYRRPGASQMDGHITINLNRIVKAQFEFQYDEYEVFKRANERRWTDAANLILKAVGPAIPYLDFATNNAVAPALEAAGYLFKAGMAFQQADGGTNSRQADAAYAQAYKIFQQVGAAQWFEGAYNAPIKAVWCLTMMGKTDSAADQFDQLSVCEEVYDKDYGLYWLAQGAILYKQKNYYAALAAAVKSLVFENKDMGTFPDALLLSADCYYELHEMYQARDVYYEIARLFDNTDWSTTARKQLEIIMANKLTQKNEMINYWETFIDITEDMNKLVEEYLAVGKAGVTKKPAAGEQSVTNKPATATQNEEIKTP